MRRLSLHHLIIDGAILVGWLATVGMVILHERGQLWGGMGNPTSTLIATIDAKEQWFGIYYQGQKIGFSQTVVVPDEHEGVPGVGVIDNGRLVFNLLGQPQQLEVRARAFIDADWRLQVFTASIQSPTQALRWVGRRHGEELMVTVTTPTSTVTKRLRDPTGSAFVNGLSSWAAFHRLRLGQSGKAWVLNPLALTPEPVYFTVRKREIVDGADALVVETDVSGLTTTSWVTPDGEVLRETSPLGWELRRESREQAMTHLFAQAPALDLLSATSVPVDRPIEEPERLERLTLLAEGLNPDGIAIQRPWQRVFAPEHLADYHRSAPASPWCLLQLDRPQQDSSSGRVLSPGLERYRRPSLFVQSDDSRITAKAAEIVGAQTDPWKQVEALHRWVYHTMVKRLTIGLPSAVDILNTPVGDCHEHTVLFTALARSRQIPTRMVAGLVYQQGRFYYHAWPEVWVGRWVPVDPTLGQLVADATHLGLIEAENEQLLALGQFVGRVRFSVLEVIENHQ